MSEYLQFDGINLSNNTRLSSELSLVEEFSYACHLGLQAVLLPRPSLRCYPINYIRNINSIGNLAHSSGGITRIAIQLWVRIPLYIPVIDDDSNTDGWVIWDSIRHHTKHNPRYLNYTTTATAYYYNHHY